MEPGEDHNPKVSGNANPTLGRRIARWATGGLVVGLVAFLGTYFLSINRAYERISGRSRLLPSPYGNIEFTQSGSGPPVLVIHGSGGGFDQGELIADAVLGNEFKRITPSRFGYLRSTYQEGATFDEQAHAYAFLLDKLGIGQVAVVTLSHGGPSALLFAAIYPERVSSLTLISAGVASSADENQEQANFKGNMLVRIYQSDLLYWSVTTLFRKQFLRLMGADDEVIEGLTPEQRELAKRLINYMNPAAPRAAGAAFDNKAKMPNERVASVKAPTLVIHAKDDALQLYHNAEFAVASITGSQLLSFEKGGHLLAIIEQATIRPAVRKQILSQ